MAAGRVQRGVGGGNPGAAGANLAVLEAMKMEHLLLAPHAGQLRAWLAAPGDYLAQGQPLLALDAVEGAAPPLAQSAPEQAPDHLRPALQQGLDRHALTLDAPRPEAMARRQAQGGRSARQNIADLCDAGSFIEYGALAIAAQTGRRSLE